MHENLCLSLRLKAYSKLKTCLILEFLCVVEFYSQKIAQQKCINTFIRFCIFKCLTSYDRGFLFLQESFFSVEYCMKPPWVKSCTQYLNTT